MTSSNASAATGFEPWSPVETDVADSGFQPDAGLPRVQGFERDDVREALAQSSPVGASISAHLADAPPDVRAEELAMVRTEGFAAGHAVAVDELTAERDDALLLLAAFQRDLKTRIDAVAAPLASAAETIIVDLVRAVVGNDIQDRPESIRARVDAAFQAHPALVAAQTKLVVNVDDALLLEGMETVELAVDRDLPRGDFRIERGAVTVEDLIAARLDAAIGT